MPYQLPDDAVAQGYKQSPHCPCILCCEDVFHSPSKSFTGTEEEFYDAGHAYYYVQRDKHWRSIYLSPKALKDAGF